MNDQLGYACGGSGSLFKTGASGCTNQRGGGHGLRRRCPGGTAHPWPSPAGVLPCRVSHPHPTVPHPLAITYLSPPHTSCPYLAPFPIRVTAEDGGQSWKREKAADSLAANLYELVFTTGGLGFVLGNDGVLLRVRRAAGCVRPKPRTPMQWAAGCWACASRRPLGSELRRRARGAELARCKAISPGLAASRPGYLVVQPLRLLCSSKPFLFLSCPPARLPPAWLQRISQA